MEDKLTPIVRRIQLSALENNEKAKLYEMLATSLESAVLPVLLRFMPHDQLDRLSQPGAKVTVESFVQLLQDTVDEKAIEELTSTMDILIRDFDISLKEEGI